MLAIAALPLRSAWLAMYVFDGTLLLDVGLFRVKPPEEVTDAWDYYKRIRTILAVDVHRPPARGACPLTP